MKYRTRIRLINVIIRIQVILLLCCLCFLFVYPVAAAGMTAQQRRGQQIYLTGNSPSGQPIQAYLINADIHLPASLMPCVNCHKYNGKGAPEGGITPADIRWFTLTKPYGVGKLGHPPYTKRSLIKAISMGLGSGGQPLNIIMPRYQLTHQDMNDLLAFLSGLGTYQANGVTDNSIKVGVILPAHNLQKSQAIQQILDAYFTDLNQQGGIYQRKIQLVFIQPPATLSEQALAQFKRRLEQSDVFAFVASQLHGLEPLVADYTQNTGIPVIGAFSSTPQLSFPLNPYIFYLLSGQTNQTLALKTFAKQVNSLALTKHDISLASNSVVIAEKYNALQPLLEHFKPPKKTPFIEIIKLDKVNLLPQLKSQMNRLLQQQVEIIYLLGSPSTQVAFFQLAADIGWKPIVMIPGSQMSDVLFDSPKLFDQRIFVAMPSLPLNYKNTGLRLYQRLQQDYEVSLQYRNSQLLALAAARLLTEGLIKTGRELKQAKLVLKMEELYKFNTHFTQPVSYGPNRRLGTSGAYIVTIDLANNTLRQVSDWVEIK